MLRSPERIILAKCGDLALAKACVADLSAAGFRGTTDIIQCPTRDNVVLGSGAYGTVSGAAIARSMLIGIIVSALLAALIVALLLPALASFPITLAVFVTSVGIGGLIGALFRFRFLKKMAFDWSAERSRFLVRCVGEPAELAKAYNVLGTSACHSVIFKELEEGENAVERISLPLQASPNTVEPPLSFSLD